jgi:carbon storage regulator
MLVVTRSVNEAVRAGEVVVRVISIKGKNVRLGFEAPKHIAIIRDDAVETDPTPPPSNNPGAPSC